MKKFFPLFLCILSFLLVIPLFALSFSGNALASYSDYAEYARVITEDTPFFSDDKGENLLFNLPYTYYVRVLEDNGEFSHVECYGNDKTLALDGFVPSKMLFYDGQSVKNPYASVTLTAGYTALLYDNSNLNSSIQYIFSGREMAFYGTLKLSDNTTLYYVSYNDKLGYVKEESILPFTLNNHPNELTFLSPEVPDIPASSENVSEGGGSVSVNADGNANYTLRIIIISCLLFAGIIALFIAFRKKPIKSPTASYYDENDYE